MNKNILKLLKNLGVATILVAPITTAISCGSSTEKTKMKKIAFFKATENSDYDETLYDLSVAEAKKLDYTVDKFSSPSNINTERANVERVINTHKYKGAIFQPINAFNSFANLKLLLNAKINVTIPDRIFTDEQIATLTPTQSKHVIMQVTSNNFAIAYKAAEAMMEYWKRKNIITNNADINGRTILLFEGEPSSSSSIERVGGFKDYFLKNSLTPNIVKITANWSQLEAQQKFETYVSNKARAGIGLFAANDQMAQGVLTSAALKKYLENTEYPIATIDGHDWSAEYITNSANLAKKRIIVNYAQRIITTMHFATYSLIYSLNREAWTKPKILEGTLDKTIQFNLLPEQIYDPAKQTIKLTGVTITRGADGQLVNGDSFI